MSFVAGAVVNLVWVVWDPEWFRHLAQAALDVIALVVTARTWQLFPFDLSSGREQVVRVGLVVALVGIAVATIVELTKLVWTGPRPATGTGRRAHPA